MEPQQSEQTRRLISEALESLEKSRDLLLRDTPSYAEGAAASDRAIQLGLEAFLTWHGVPFSSEGTPFAFLGMHAQHLSSALRTPLQRARGIEALARGLAGKEELTLNDREASVMSYYTARNLLDIVVAELPEAVRPVEAVAV